MDLLKAEIEKKRRQLENSNLVGPQKKYFKRGELLQKEQEEYVEKLKARLSGKDDLFAASTSSLALGLGRKDGAGEDDQQRILPRKEVIRRLRDRNEPILLFGESELEAFRRLRRLEVQEPESGKGFRNDFQEAMEKVDQIYLDELIKSKGKTDDGKSIHDVKVDANTTTYEEIQELGSRLGTEENRSQDAADVLKVIQFLQYQWGERLNNRPEAEKMSTKGKLAAATYNQTNAYMQPLYRKLRKNTLSEDLLEHLVIIVKYLLERNYVKASDAYLQMAIGNAPWPIGVTMVGIHARTGREKIFSQNIAHVLNDETQRKFIQGLKRLMTQCQRLYPTDPSRCVEYTKE